MKKLMIIILSMSFFSFLNKGEDCKENKSYMTRNHNCRLEKIFFEGALLMYYEYDEKLRLSKIKKYKKGKNTVINLINYGKEDRIASIETVANFPDKYDKFEEDYFLIKTEEVKYKYKKNTNLIDQVQYFSGFVGSNPYKKVRLKYSITDYYTYNSKSQLIEIQRKKNKKINKGTKVKFDYDEKSNPTSVKYFSISTGELLFELDRKFADTPNLIFDFNQFNLESLNSKNMLISQSRRVYKAYHESYNGDIVQEHKCEFEFNSHGLVQKSKIEVVNSADENIQNYEYEYEYICNN